MTDYSQMTDEQLEDIIRQARGDTREDDKSFFSDVGDYLKKNMEVPGGIGGAMGGAAAGAAIGSAVPVVGTAIGGIAGGIIGGAGGSFAGSAASDVMADEEIDWAAARKEAKTSVLYDAAFLGAGKVLRPLSKALGVTDALKSIVGKTDIPVSKRIVDIEDLEAGTLESLQMTQEWLLSRGAGGLSAAQTGQAGAMRKIAEGIGDLGVFSGWRTDKRILENNKVINEAIDELIGNADRLGTSTIGGVGEIIAGAVETGRRAAGSLYQDGLNELNKEFGKKLVSTGPVIGALKQFQKENATRLGSKIGKKTLSATDKFMNRLIDDADGLTKVKQADLESLVEFQKEVTNMTRKAMPGAKNADPQAVKDLTKLNKAMQAGISDALTKISPNAAKTYKAMNTAYGDTMKELMPKVNKRIMAAADAEDFDSIGRLLITGTNNSKIKKMMNSLDVAHAAAVEAAKKGGPKIKVKDAAQAKKFVKQGYLQEVFRGIDGATDFTKMRNMAKQLNSPESLARAKTVLGDDFVNYKKIVNVISDTTKREDGNFMALALRQKEMGALSSAGQIAVGGAAAFSSIGGMGAIFLSPLVLSKLATNKAAVNRLLGLNAKIIEKGPALSPEFVSAQIGKIFESFNEEDRDHISRMIR